jgi:hypothetical protein
LCDDLLEVPPTQVVLGALRGQLREILIRDLFRPLLPADVGLGTGEIVTANDKHSKQQDVVIYDRWILPPLLFEQNVGLFPVESVLYTIEVKSILTSRGLRTSHASCREMQEFTYLPGKHDDGNPPVPHVIRPAIHTVFAFGSDQKRIGEGCRYDQIRGPDPPAIAAICVVGKGYWYWGKDKWIEWSRTGALEEVVGFIAGVLNTYRGIIAARGEPTLGRYLIQ